MIAPLRWWQRWWQRWCRRWWRRRRRSGDNTDNMKLDGIIPFAFLAVSTPTTVPAGALAATVKLLIVIVMTSPVGNEAVRATGWPGASR
jgi:hypothetical protein